MLKHLIECDLVVRATQRPCQPGTRRCQRLEAQLFQGPRAPHVPWVRHHEAPRGVQVVERGDPILMHVHATPRQRARSLHSSDPYRVPGPWDPKPVADAIEIGMAALADCGFDAEACLVGLDGSDDVEARVTICLLYTSPSPR